MEPKSAPCSVAADDEVFERYLRDELSDEQREAFELHYLECAKCLDTLETYRAVVQQLKHARQTPVARVPAATPRRSYAPLMWGLAAAATLVAAVLIQRRPMETAPVPEQAAAAPAPSQPVAAQAPPVTAVETPAIDRERLLLLARFDPPAYTPPALRGTTAEAHAAFRRAMESYSAGDYSQARPALESVVSADPQAPGANFFLAISNLLQGRTDEGIAGLRRTIALGDTAYLEDSRFYLGKSLVRTGDLAAAERELQAVVTMNGDRRAEAAAVVTLLRGGR